MQALLEQAVVDDLLVLIGQCCAIRLPQQIDLTIGEMWAKLVGRAVEASTRATIILDFDVLVRFLREVARIERRVLPQLLVRAQFGPRGGRTAGRV